VEKIILDTNFLLIPAQFRVDIFREIERICDFPYQIQILDKTIDELNNIILKQKGKHKSAAKLALSIVKAKDLKMKTINSSKPVDEILVELSNKGYIIATSDKEVKQRARRYITLKQKKYLIIGCNNVLQTEA
jgi:rRNA-processing protein FCF1